MLEKMKKIVQCKKLKIICNKNVICTGNFSFGLLVLTRLNILNNNLKKKHLKEIMTDLYIPILVFLCSHWPM